MSRITPARVLLLFSSSSLGGAEVSLTKMASVNPDRYIFSSLDTSKGALDTFITERGLSFYPLKDHSHLSFLRYFFIFHGIFRLLRSHQVNIVYVCGIRAAFIVRLIKIFLPGLLIVHGVRWNPASSVFVDRIFGYSERLLMPWTDFWITNSSASKNTLVQTLGLDETRVEAIYNGVEFHNARLGKERDFVRVVTVANLSPRKGILEYLDAVEIVLEQYPMVQFVFAGRDDMGGTIQNEILRRKIGDKVHVLGFVADVGELLFNSDIFVLPSLWGEGCPTSILEAQSYALPVIASDIDGVPELVDHNVNGFLVSNPGPEFAKYISRLVDSPILREQLGRAGLENLKSNFSIIKCASKHEVVWQSLCNKSFQNTL